MKYPQNIKKISRKINENFIPFIFRSPACIQQNYYSNEMKCIFPVLFKSFVYHRGKVFKSFDFRRETFFFFATALQNIRFCLVYFAEENICKIRNSVLMDEILKKTTTFFPFSIFEITEIFMNEKYLVSLTKVV